jgi:REP element-mobilizing transposase RayT
MANTYTQLYTHLIFAVKSHDCFIQEHWNAELQQYISGITGNLKCKMLAINNMPDHLHLFVSRHPTVSESVLAQKVKNNSSRWINQKKLSRKVFAWQSGYGAFTYSRSQIKDVCAYIENQKTHHQKHTFQEEYIAFLKKFEIDFDKNYLFEFFDDNWEK